MSRSQPRTYRFVIHETLAWESHVEAHSRRQAIVQLLADIGAAGFDGMRLLDNTWTVADTAIVEGGQ